MTPSSLHSKLASVTNSLIAVKGGKTRQMRVKDASDGGRRRVFMSVKDLPSRSFLSVPASASLASSILVGYRGRVIRACSG